MQVLQCTGRLPGTSSSMASICSEYMPSLLEILQHVKCSSVHSVADKVVRLRALLLIQQPLQLADTARDSCALADYLKGKLSGASQAAAVFALMPLSQLQQMLAYVGTGHWLLIVQVSQLWKQLYEQLGVSAVHAVP
jgi:hypothetical protein